MTPDAVEDDHKHDPALKKIRGAGWGPRTREWDRSVVGWKGWQWLRGQPLALAVFVGVMVTSMLASFAYFVLSGSLNINEAEATARIEVVRLALTVAAGFGGLVALVVAYRKQLDLEEGRFIERFGAASEQLGHSDAAVRLAGIYAMSGVADRARDDEQRQQCIDVLCGYLRLPYFPEDGHDHRTHRIIRQPSSDSPRHEEEIHFQYRQNDREVRRTIVRVLLAHLREASRSSWSGCNFDFTGAHFETADFAAARFKGKSTNFSGATFSGKNTSFENTVFGSEDTLFEGAKFNGENTWFKEADFTGDTTNFLGATFSGKNTNFYRATFSGRNTVFYEATFEGENTMFCEATFSGDSTRFDGVSFNSDTTMFDGAIFSGENTRFARATFSGNSTSFDGVTFSGNTAMFAGVTFNNTNATFDKAIFSSEKTIFCGATFRGGSATFEGSVFSGDGTLFTEVAFIEGLVRFNGASFVGRIVSFENPRAWNPGPKFSWEDPSARKPKPDHVKPEEWPPPVISRL